MMYSAQYSLVFDCNRAGYPEEDWVAVCRTIPGISVHGGTSDAALREATFFALRVIAELIAKGDPRWAQFKDVDG